MSSVYNNIIEERVFYVYGIETQGREGFASAPFFITVSH